MSRRITVRRCLPGVPDSWNRLLVQLLTSETVTAALRPPTTGFGARWAAVTSGFHSKTWDGASPRNDAELMDVLYPDTTHAAGWM